MSEPCFCSLLEYRRVICSSYCMILSTNYFQCLLLDLSIQRAVPPRNLGWRMLSTSHLKPLGSLHFAPPWEVVNTLQVFLVSWNTLAFVPLATIFNVEGHVWFQGHVLILKLVYLIFIFIVYLWSLPFLITPWFQF